MVSEASGRCLLNDYSFGTCSEDLDFMPWPFVSTTVLDSAGDIEAADRLALLADSPSSTSVTALSESFGRALASFTLESEQAEEGGVWPAHLLLLNGAAFKQGVCTAVAQTGGVPINGMRCAEPCDITTASAGSPYGRCAVESLHGWHGECEEACVPTASAGTTTSDEMFFSIVHVDNTFVRVRSYAGGCVAWYDSVRGGQVAMAPCGMGALFKLIRMEELDLAGGRIGYRLEYEEPGTAEPRCLAHSNSHLTIGRCVGVEVVIATMAATALPSKWLAQIDRGEEAAEWADLRVGGGLSRPHRALVIVCVAGLPVMADYGGRPAGRHEYEVLRVGDNIQLHRAGQVVDSVRGNTPLSVCHVTDATSVDPTKAGLHNVKQMAIYPDESGIPAAPASLFSNAWWIVAHLPNGSSPVSPSTAAECLASCDTCVSHTWDPSSGECRTVPAGGRCIENPAESHCWVHSPGRDVTIKGLHESVVADTGTWAAGLTPPPDAYIDYYSMHPHTKSMNQSQSFTVFAISACVHFTVPACAVLANTPIWIARGESAVIDGLQASVLPDQIGAGRHKVCINDTNATGRTTFRGFEGEIRHGFACEPPKEGVLVEYTTTAASPSGTGRRLMSAGPTQAPTIDYDTPTFAPSFDPFCLKQASNSSCNNPSGCRHMSGRDPSCAPTQLLAASWDDPRTVNGVDGVRCRNRYRCRSKPTGWVNPDAREPFHVLPNVKVNLADSALVCRGPTCANRICTAAPNDAWYSPFTQFNSPICALAPASPSAVGASAEQRLDEDSLCDKHYSNWTTIRNSTACGRCQTALVPFPGDITVQVYARTGTREDPTTGVAEQERYPNVSTVQFNCSVKRNVSFSCFEECPVDCTFTDVRIVGTENATCYTGKSGYRGDWKAMATGVTLYRNSTFSRRGGLSCQKQKMKQLTQFQELGISGWCDAPPNDAKDNLLTLSFRPGNETTKEQLLSIAPDTNFCMEEDQNLSYCPAREVPKTFWAYTIALASIVFIMSKEILKSLDSTG